MDTLLKDYEAYHQHPLNIRIHRICVPVVALSFFGLLNIVGAPLPLGYILIAFFFVYYGIYAPSFLLRFAFLVALLIGIDLVLKQYLGSVLWIFYVCINLVGWILLLIGHKIEGNRPAALENTTTGIHSPFMAIIHSMKLFD
jgi:uncharacterized membrane protein YGL010W